MKIYNYLKNRLKLRRYILNTFNKYVKYLSKGKYKIVHPSKNIYYLDNTENYKIIEKITSHPSRFNYKKSLSVILKNIIDFIILPKTIVINNNNSDIAFKGNLIIFTRDYKDLKILDYNNKLVKTFYKNIERYNNIKNLNIYFSTHFHTTIYSYNDLEFSIDEMLIDFVPYDQLSLSNKYSVLENIFTLYYSYIKNTINYHEFYFMKTMDLINQLPEIVTTCEVFKTIQDNVDINILYEDFPFILIHGDLNLTNVLIDKNDLYIIDYEFSQYSFFFHDLIHILFIEGQWAEKDFILQYLKGDFDSKFVNMFKLFNLDFSKYDRVQYFLLYLIQWLYIYLKNIDSSIGFKMYTQNLNVKLQEYLSSI